MFHSFGEPGADFEEATMPRANCDPGSLLASLIRLAAVASATPPPLSAQAASRLAIDWTAEAPFDIPESVAWDPARRVLYVSSIVGDFGERDANGFLSLVEKGGTLRAARWVESLDASEGLAVRGDTLFAADLNRLVVIRLPYGAVLARLAADGARFLNGMSLAEDGDVYASDTASGPIFRLRGDTLERWLADAALAGPNGLLAEDDRVLVGCFTTGRTFAVDRRTGEIKRMAAEIPGLDGLVGLGDGRYLVTDGNGRVVGTDFSGPSEVLLDTRADRANAADLEYAAELRLVVVPMFFDNRVVAYRLLP
jgi:hypothetical protein